MIVLTKSLKVTKILKKTQAAFFNQLVVDDIIHLAFELKDSYYKASLSCTCDRLLREYHVTANSAAVRLKEYFEVEEVDTNDSSELSMKDREIAHLKERLGAMYVENTELRNKRGRFS